MSDQTRFFRLLALTSYFALLIFIVLWHFILIPDSPYSVLFRVLFWVVPLLLPMRGILAGKPYTHAWANFIIMFYLLHGLTAIYSNPDEWYFALVEIILASVMFIGCSFFARFRGRELGLGLKKLKQE